MFIGIGLPITRGKGVGGVSLPVIAPGSMLGMVADGLSAQSGGVGPGPSNPFHQLLNRAFPLLQPCEAPIFALSGSSIAGSGGTAWINPYAVDALTKQRPHVLIAGPFGANDNVLSTDPTISQGMIDWKAAVTYAYGKFTAYAGSSKAYLFVVQATPPSNKTTEATYRNAAWAAQAAHAAALTAADNRVVFAPLVSMLDANGSYMGVQYSIDAGTAWNGNASVAGTVLTINSTASGAVAVGQKLTGVGVTEGTTVVSGAGLIWVVTPSQTVASTAMYSDAFWVHFDERGGWTDADLLWSVISPYIASAVDAEFDRIFAGTYPYMAGAQLDSDRNLVGTGGTVDATVSGTIATSKAIQDGSGVGNTHVSVSMAVDNGSRNKIVIPYDGAGIATGGRLRVYDKSNFGVTASPGQHIRAGCRVKSTSKGHNWGFAHGNYGQHGGGGFSLGNNARVGALETHNIDGGFVSYGVPLFGADTSFSTMRTWAMYWRNTTAIGGTIELSQFFIYLMSRRGLIPTAYIGNTVDAAGTAYFSAAGQVARGSGSVSAAAGGTLRGDPGLVVPSGILGSDYTAIKFYKGTAANTGFGTGTQIGTTVGNGVWSITVGAGVVTTGDKIWVDFTVLDPFDNTTLVTWRCALANVVTAT